MTKQDYKDLEIMKSEVESQIQALEQRQGESYQKLGCEYYKVMGETYDISLEPIVGELKAHEEKKVKLGETLSDIEERMKEPVDNICPKCGKVMESMAKFCSECGSKLSDEVQAQAYAPSDAVCRSCGNLLKPGSKFCGSCGTVV